MALALTRSPGQSVLFTGSVTLRLEVREVHPYHVMLQVDDVIRHLRAGEPVLLAPDVRLQLAGVNGRQARLAITAPPSVHVLREELQQRHTVRRGRTGDYECSCGATWDYRDGVEHP